METEKRNSNNLTNLRNLSKEGKQGGKKRLHSLPPLTWEEFNQLYYVEASGQMSSEIQMCDFTPMYTKGTASIKTLTNVRLYARKDMSLVKEYKVDVLPDSNVNTKVKEMIQQDFSIVESVNHISPKMNLQAEEEPKEFFGGMFACRDLTEEESESYNESLDKLFTPIGVNVFEAN